MIHQMHIRRSSAAIWVGGSLAAVLLNGCTLPYRPSADASLVQVILLNTASPNMCIDGNWFRLEAAEQGTTRSVMVPTGKRITLRVDDVLLSAGASTCRPTLSVEPAAGTRLALHSALAGHTCLIEIVREDHNTPTGVAPEPSIGPPQC